ncbi:MAG: DUF1501 domain-containing protein, partial [Bacteroidota bacterium]
MSQHFNNLKKGLDRREFLVKTSLGLGATALAGLLGKSLFSGTSALPEAENLLLNTGPSGYQQLIPKAKRIVNLFMSGGPSQMDLFDYKPILTDMHGEDLPASVRGDQRLTGMSAQQSTLPITASLFDFKQYGQSGAWVSELMPYTATMVDDICFIKSMFTEQINHDPAITFLQTGHQLAGRPSIGSWLSYGLGSDNENLPAFIVLVSKNASGQPLYARLWGNGFLPTHHQGVQFRSGKDPVLFLNDPEGYTGQDRADMIEHLRRLNAFQEDTYNDPAVSDRIKQFEMAYRMQTSVPEVTDLSDEPDEVFDLYGPDSRDPGTYAANCLLARKLLEQDVKFVQLYHQGWDHHLFLPSGIRQKCREVDQPTAALLKDLKRRGLLEDTLVIWGGEFG